MESAIVRNLQPKNEPVALIWSNIIPDDALQFKKGKFGCILNLFAMSAQRGIISGGNRENITCIGGRAALGFGIGFDATDELLERYSALMSKGIKSTINKESYQEWIEAAPRNSRSLREYGERRHSNTELSREWILNELPRYDIPYEYIVFKPLSRANPDENIRAVIFLVNPIELAGLVTLTGSVMHGTDPIRIPQGADCYTISAFAYNEEDSESPRAVLGMIGIDGREIMRKYFNDDVVTLTLPMSLFQQMELEADDCIFQTPSWRILIGQ